MTEESIRKKLAACDKGILLLNLRKRELRVQLRLLREQWEEDRKKHILMKRAQSLTKMSIVDLELLKKKLIP